MANEFTVVIGHAHPHVRAGLRQILLEEGHAEVVAEAENADQVRGLLAGRQWDMMILSAALPGPPLQEQLALYRSVHPSVHSIVLSGYAHLSVAVLLVECKADAVILEERINDDLLVAVEHVRRGEYMLCRGSMEDSWWWAARRGEEPFAATLSSGGRRSRNSSVGPQHSATTH